jgi:hypothetical protein
MVEALFSPCSGLDDVNVFPSDGLVNLGNSLPVCFMVDGAAPETNLQVAVT